MARHESGGNPRNLTDTRYVFIVPWFFTFVNEKSTGMVLENRLDFWKKLWYDYTRACIICQNLRHIRAQLDCACFCQDRFERKCEIYDSCYSD